MTRPTVQNTRCIRIMVAFSAVSASLCLGGCKKDSAETGDAETTTADSAVYETAPQDSAADPDAPLAFPTKDSAAVADDPMANGAPAAPGSSQEPITSIALRPFAEGTNWVLAEPLVYRVGTSRDSVVVPRGFVTDFASIPPSMQGLISALGPYVLPAVVHDYLYWEQRCSRRQADRLFLVAMTEMGVPYSDRGPMYLAVTAGGQPAWDQNARERRSGLSRIIPEGVRKPTPLESWVTYRRYLRSANVRPAPPAAISPGFCAHGS